jgi:hypothetical protein
MIAVVGSLATTTGHQVDPKVAIDLVSWLANSSPAVIFIVVLVALSRGWLVLPRELTARDARIVELTAEKNEYKNMALQAVGLGERVINAAEKRIQQ